MLKPGVEKDQLDAMIEVLMHERNSLLRNVRKSTTSKYIIPGLEVINLIELLSSTDRDGNWGLQVTTAEKLLPVVLEFDRIKYSRYASWCVEKTVVLKNENKYLNDKLMEGHFVIKDKDGGFNNVSRDTNNQSKEWSSG